VGNDQLPGRARGESTPAEFYAIPLGERIELLTSSRIKFEKDNQVMSPLDALRKK